MVKAYRLLKYFTSHMISPNPQIFQSLLTYQAFPTKKWLDVLIDRAHVSQGKCFQPICSEMVTQLKSQQILFLSHLTMPFHLRFHLLTISAAFQLGCGPLVNTQKLCQIIIAFFGQFLKTFLTFLINYLNCASLQITGQVRRTKLWQGFPVMHHQ